LAFPAPSSSGLEKVYEVKPKSFAPLLVNRPFLRFTMIRRCFILFFSLLLFFVAHCLIFFFVVSAGVAEAN